MATVSFTPNLQRHIEAPSLAVKATDVGGALKAVFSKHPLLESYVLKDDGELRPHMAVFVNGETIRDRIGLSDPIGPDSEVYVMQALSGG